MYADTRIAHSSLGHTVVHIFDKGNNHFARQGSLLLITSREDLTSADVGMGNGGGGGGGGLGRVHDTGQRQAQVCKQVNNTL